MTPRSRKPVMLLAGLNTADQQHTTYTSQTSFSSLREEDEDDVTSEPPLKPYPITDNASQHTNSGLDHNGGSVVQGTDEEGSSLTSTFRYGSLFWINVLSFQRIIYFRDYLLSRSVMTDSPADLSFSSQSDDYDSDADLEHLSESKMSESLLFCMNGNTPDEDNETIIGARSVSAEQLNEAGKDSELPNKSELDETSL